MKKGIEFKKTSGVKEVTLREQLRKGNDIAVKFLNVNEKKKLSNIQLGVFINGELKYTSRKGVFAIKTVTYPKIRRKGWKIYTEIIEKDRLIFEEEKDYKKFIRFCTQLRDCIRIQEMYQDACYNIVNTAFSEPS